MQQCHIIFVCVCVKSFKTRKLNIISCTLYQLNNGTNGAPTNKVLKIPSHLTSRLLSFRIRVVCITMPLNRQQTPQLHVIFVLDYLTGHYLIRQKLKYNIVYQPSYSAEVFSIFRAFRSAKKADCTFKEYIRPPVFHNNALVHIKGSLESKIYKDDILAEKVVTYKLYRSNLALEKHADLKHVTVDPICMWF